MKYLLITPAMLLATLAGYHLHQIEVRPQMEELARLRNRTAEQHFAAGLIDLARQTDADDSDVTDIFNRVRMEVREGKR